MSTFATRLFIAVLIILLLALQSKLWFGKGGLRDVHVLQNQVEAQAEAITLLEERNQTLRAEVDDLKTGLDAIEERAREELGLIKEGETFYQFVQPPSESTEGAKTTSQSRQIKR